MRTYKVVIAVGLALFGLTNIGKAQRFSSNNRRAVVLEGFYALRTSHDGGCDKTISGNCVSSWNFLNSDTGAYSFLKSSYGCNPSDWAVSGDLCYFVGAIAPSFYSNLGSYGYSVAGGGFGAVGRGGQCTFFANLILYRSQSHTAIFPTLSNMALNTEANLQTAKEGDILQLYGDTSPGFTTNHIAIVVQIYRTGTIITALDVIDANYLSDISGVANREMIARHAFCAVMSGCPFAGVQMVQGHYKIWKGTAYYGESYNPNI